MLVGRPGRQGGGGQCQRRPRANQPPVHQTGTEYVPNRPWIVFSSVAPLFTSRADEALQYYLQYQFREKNKIVQKKKKKNYMQVRCFSTSNIV